MPRAAAAAILVLASVLPCAAARADGCGEQTTAMRLATTRYRTSVNEMRVLQRDLPSAARRSDEYGLRIVRRYGLAMRDVHEQRTQILQLYADLVAHECPPFDQEGLEQTRDDFRFYSEEEEKILSAVRRQASDAVAGN